MAYLRNLLLTAVLAAVLIALLLVQAFAPGAVLPPVNLPNLIGLCAVVQVLGFYAKSDADVVWSAAMAFVTFFLLVWASGLRLGVPVWKLALVGAAVFAVTDWLFRSIMERLRSGGTGAIAPIVTAFGLFLAGQSFAGIIL